MATEIIVAVIAAAGGLIGSLIGMHQNANITNYRLEQLEKKMDKHNNFIERLYKVEKKVDVHEEKFKVANHRIEDLEHEE